MKNTFEVEIRSEDRAAVIVVRGELDLATCPALERALSRAAASDAPLLIMDFRGLDFIDSRGLSTVIKAHRDAEASGRRFAVVRGPSQIQRLLGLTGLEERLELVDSPEELLGGVAGE